MRGLLYRLCIFIVLAEIGFWGVVAVIWGIGLGHLCLDQKADFHTPDGSHLLYTYIGTIAVSVILVGIFLRLYFKDPGEWKFLDLLIVVVTTGIMCKFGIDHYDPSALANLWPAPEKQETTAREETGPAPITKPVVDKVPSVYITPNMAKYVNADHVHDVSQPVQPGQSTETNTVSTPATRPASGEFVPPDPLPAQRSWTWMTTDGKSYDNVEVVTVEADRVTIIHSKGVATIDTSMLYPEVQHLLNYDPDLAAKTRAARQSAATPATPPVPPPAPVSNP